jgi:DNA-binding MarR family transcriptional regulator
MRPAAPLLSVGPENVSRLRLTLLRLARRLRQQANAGVTPSQLSVLATVDRHGPVGLKELAAIEQVKPPSITRIVAALEEEGLVTRAVSDEDRRAARVALTTEGKQALARVRRRRDAWLAQRLAELDADEVDALVRALPALEKLLEEKQP